VPKRDEKKKRKPSGNGDSSTGDKTPELVD
jgi:hypothetical protein